MDRKTLISNYFLGNLSEEENKEFKELLETDSDFKREVVFQERVKRAIAYKNHSKLKQQLQGFENKFKVSRTRKIWWFGAAASIVVLIVSSIMLFNFNYTNDELFATYFEAPKNIVHPIVRGNTVNNDMTIAFVAYQKEDYIKAQNMFESLFNKTNNSELLFYQSISLIELGRLNEAIA
ncbi:MAG: hypothetical protein KJN66_07040, partial [Bacteroidia bacterium]|nr:hypothetical protein [Bacteroidia bacterium]